MFRSYFKIAQRNMLRNKLLSFINISGLSVAISCCLVFYLLLEQEYTSDSFHKNGNKIFLITYKLEGDKNNELWANSPEPLGPALKSDFSQINRVVRVKSRSGVVKFGENIFTEFIRFADNEFFDMFTFKLKMGDRSTFYDKRNVILSEESAIKYFGDTNPMGRSIEIYFGNDGKKVFAVGAVAEKFPHNASFSFNIIAPYENLTDMTETDAYDWSRYVNATFIELNDNADINSIIPGMGKYVLEHNETVVERPIANFSYEPLPTLSWRSQELRASLSQGSTPEA